jgi:hypothetical protein
MRRARAKLRPVRKTGLLAALALAQSVGGCRCSHAESPPAAPDAAPAARGGEPSAEKLAAHPELPPERRAIVLVGGQERAVDAADAVRAGFTIVDLRDDWTPYIFNEGVSADGASMTNRYRSVFLGLANDTGDADGQALGPPPKDGVGRDGEKEHNYLELYGIPPSLSVLRERFLEDAPATSAGGRCADVDFAKIRALQTMPTIEVKNEKKERARIARLVRDLEAKKKKAGVASLEELAALDKKTAKDVKTVLRSDLSQYAFPEVEKRLTCEDMFPSTKRERHAAGHFDEAMRLALIKFQHKNKIYDGAAFRAETMAALGRTPLENDYAAFVRSLTERAVSAADVLEDGSVAVLGPKDGPPLWTNAAGEKQPVRNLVEEAAKATLSQLGLADAPATLAFFQRHSENDFKYLRAAIRIPPPPEYYAADMDLSVVIDRGDVFYDPPFDEKGKPANQVRKHFPKLTLRVKYRGQTIPLVYWRTTIGGWRSDLASNGYEYYRYKGSDVGPRAWRNVVAGPVWIAPNSTPIRTLVKGKVVKGAWQTVVNYDEVGPGYLSAYGLVAAYNIVPGKGDKPDWDNGVRVHGSSEYRSIYAPEGYSHGCHRLVNHLAVRLFSYVLQHHKVNLIGDRPLNFARQFLWKEDVYEMRLPSRGYWFELDPPLPVNVLEGNILGDAQKPIKNYVPKPGVQYPPGPPPVPPDSPEARAGGD